MYLKLAADVEAIKDNRENAGRPDGWTAKSTFQQNPKTKNKIGFDDVCFRSY